LLRLALRRADPGDDRPARRVARRKGLPQTFIDLILGRRAVRNARLLPMLEAARLGHHSGPGIALAHPATRWTAGTDCGPCKNPPASISGLARKISIIRHPPPRRCFAAKRMFGLQ